VPHTRALEGDLKEGHTGLVRREGLSVVAGVHMRRKHRKGWPSRQVPTRVTNPSAADRRGSRIPLAAVQLKGLSILRIHQEGAVVGQVDDPVEDCGTDAEHFPEVVWSAYNRIQEVPWGAG
jgi:hypothetical protein